MNKKEFRLKVFSLSEHLFPMVSRMIGNNANAEDAIQEIMMKLWLKRKQIGQHPNITGFVFLTTRNYCIETVAKGSVFFFICFGFPFLVQKAFFWNDFLVFYVYSALYYVYSPLIFTIIKLALIDL